MMVSGDLAVLEPHTFPIMFRSGNIYVLGNSFSGMESRFQLMN
jgi:hypothetical protein